MSGGEVLEDVNFFRQEAFKANPDYRFCSADTIARDLKKLAVENTGFQAVESGKTYRFNINDRLNELLLKALLQLGMVSKEQPVTFDYDNQRGSSERTFDMQNNDFGWKHLSFSFMKENTVFMILTALIRNFYVWLVGKVAAYKDFGLEATSRVKKFVFRFVQVPFRWVFRSRQWHLQLFTSRPYDKLRL